jgi:hypothetical protein
MTKPILPLIWDKIDRMLYFALRAFRFLITFSLNIKQQFQKNQNNSYMSQKWRTNGALRCRRDYRKRQKNVKKILLDLFADLSVFESGN